MTKRPDLASITALVADVQEQLDQLNRKGAQADPLDLELFDATVQFLSANVNVYRKSFVPVEAESEPSAPAIAQPTKTEEAWTPPIEWEPEPKPVVHVQEAMETEVEETEVAETEVEETEPEVEEMEPEAEEPQFEAEEPQPEVAESDVQDDAEFATRPRSINEILAGQLKSGAYGEPRSSASKIGEQSRITNLKTAISLNDKLLFIKDLFNGYSLAYSEAIELLNRYDSYEDADEFLQSNYAVKNQWASKVETVNKFYDILKRRFPQV